MATGLVACCKKKLDHPAPARDLYQSPLFRFSRAYVECTCGGWAILSAKYGLVLPCDVIDPYDLSLRKMSRAEVSEWAAKIRQRIREVFPGESFLVLAGRTYMSAVEGLPHEAPLSGMSIGRRLSWLKAHLERCSVWSGPVRR
jgi:hypothetical protein